MYISSRYAKCVEVKLKQKSSRQEIVIIVQYVKNEEGEIMPKVIGLTGGIASGK